MKRVKDIMQAEVVTVPADMPIPELAGLLSRRMISGAPVVEADGKLLGVVSLSDIAAWSATGRAARLEAARKNLYYSDAELEDYLVGFFTVDDFGPDGVVRDIMTPAVYSLSEDATLLEAAELMKRARIHRVLVTRDGQAVGIVSTMDLVIELTDLLAAKA